jgi:uncharacterized membrane protein YbhN (UPF0104 family)
VVLALVLLAVLVALVPTDELVEALRRLPPAAWLAGPLLYLGLHLIGILKWRTLMRAARVQLPFRTLARCYYHGLFGNLFLPSLVGGDLIKVSLAVRSGGKLGGVLLASLVDRLLDLMALTLLAAAGAWALPTAIPGSGGTALKLVSVVLVAGAVSGLAALRLLPPSLLPRRVRRLFVDMRRAVAALLRRPIALGAAFAGALSLQAGLVSTNMLIARLLDLGIPPTAWLFVWPMAKISAVVPLTQGGIGVRETTQVALLGALGFAPAEALAVGLTFQAMVVLGGLVAGALALLLAGGAAAPSPAEAPS